MVDRFQDLDAEGDGAVTQAEMDKRFGSIVERMDRNDDGQVDRAGTARKARGARATARKAASDRRRRGPVGHCHSL